MALCGLSSLQPFDCNRGLSATILRGSLLDDLARCNLQQDVQDACFMIMSGSFWLQPPAWLAGRICLFVGTEKSCNLLQVVQSAPASSCRTGLLGMCRLAGDVQACLGCAGISGHLERQS